ncbi:hypothetical protein YTPLAS18_06670 [Nitrospira sp.]|nr:hypothetical protein YTPLAS18_06670 [Nitrospira sp.]
MSHSAVQRLTQTRAVTSAILLTARNVFTHTVVPAHGSIGPLTRIAGLTLFQRCLLTLQRCGLSQVFILSGDEAESLKAVLAEGPAITMGIRWIPVREFPPEDPRTWETLAADATGACVVVGPQVAFSRGLIETLRGMGQVDDLVVVLRDEDRSRSSAGPQDRGNLRKHESLMRLAGIVRAGAAKPSHVAGVASEVVLVPAGGFVKGSALAELLLTRGREDQAGDTPMARLVEAAAADGRVSVVEARAGSTTWAREVHEAGDAKCVERALYGSLKSNFEGVVDKYLNRRLSPLFTKIFLALKMTPNAITVLATMIGLIGAVCFAQGSYVAGLLGALLFQWSAVIDCCDGEVARLTFAESPFGAKLDLWLDNLVHVAIFAGLAYGAYHHSPAGLDPRLVLWGGVAAVAANVVSFFSVTRLTVRQHDGARSPWVDFLLKNVATRDFSLIVLVCAVIGQLPWFLMVAAAGSALFALVTLVLLFFVRPTRE